MKSATVILLCSLLLAFACQLGHAGATHHGQHTSSAHHAHHSVKSPEKDSFLDLSSLVPSVDTITSGVESVSADISSTVSTVSSIASFLLSAINWAFVPVNIVLQVVVVVCGAPFLVGVVPYVTWALAIMSLGLAFVPLKTVSDYAVYVLQLIYNMIRPLLAKYVIYYETIESFICAVYGTAGTMVRATSSATNAISDGASKGFSASYNAADKIGQGIEAVMQKTAKLATAAINISKDVPTFLKQVTKEVFSTKKYSNEQLDGFKQNMIMDFGSRTGTSIIPPPLPYATVPRVLTPPTAENVEASTTSNDNTAPSSPSKKGTRRRTIPSSRRKSNSAQNIPPSEYLDMTMAPSLTPKIY